MNKLVGVLCFVIVFCVLFVHRGICDPFVHHSGSENADHFSNEWMVRIHGGKELAELVALELGYIYGEEVAGFPDTYVFMKNDHAMKRRTPYTVLTRRLFDNPKVQWAEQLFAKKRQKRDFVYEDDKTAYSLGSLVNSIDTQKYETENITDFLAKKIPTSREKREDMKIPKHDMFFNDELWSQEWYLQDTRTRDDLPKLDLNVLPVYKMGITGKDIKVSILDDGIEYRHDDLKANYEPSISWDCNEKDADPAPRYDKEHRNAHGTRCAGEVAMTANNGKCGVGIAYNAKIGGIKLLDGKVNDIVEGSALGFAYDKVDIYSASWGPNDDGQTVEGPGRLAMEALWRGITKGRNGKGAIFVWASGNGGSRGDNCNCDGYIGSIYTVSVGSASQRGAFPWYGEPCAATLTVTYSSGAYEDQMIATTDLNNACTVRHTGTSASAPLAAGIIALALEANQNLTWRDVQHLIVWTSEYSPLADNLGWITNGAGLRFDVRFGFGLMNAHALVTAASNWTNVPEKYVCESTTESVNQTISYNIMYTAEFFATGCSGTENEVNYLEHVEVKANIMYNLRGVLELYLTSPKGTRVPLLSPRMLDRSSRGFSNWRFMSVATWGEAPQGTWRLEINDRIGPEQNKGFVGPLSLILHGTRNIPDNMKNGPRTYNEKYVSENSKANADVVYSVVKEPVTSVPFLETTSIVVLNNDLDTLNSQNDVDNLKVEIPNNSDEETMSLWSYLKSLSKTIPDVNDLDASENNPKDYDYSDTGYETDDEKALNRVHHQNYRVNDDTGSNMQNYILKYMNE